MCASYGLGGARPDSTLPYDLAPLSEPANQQRLVEWVGAQHGRAAITGRRARNLNPVIMANAGTIDGTDGMDGMDGIHATGNADDRTLKFGWWWLWADGTGPVRFSAFNSRDDRLMRSWRRPFQTRALLPATWYVEKKVRFHLPDDELFAIAAITSTVIDDASGEQKLTYSMVTRDALGEAANTWHRMPLVLPRDMHSEWLDPQRTGDASLVAEAQLASVEISQAMRPTKAADTIDDPAAENRLF